MVKTESRSASIRPLTRADLQPLKTFTDLTIGAGYYSLNELEDILERSQAIDAKGINRMCSLLLCNSEDILGVRFTYPPGKWSHGKGRGLSPLAWPHDLKSTGYFQSLFLVDHAQGEGWGVKLSQASIDVLKKLGARGVVCHSWKESPFNSSSKYLEKMGFMKIAEHPLYWADVDYNCTRCLKPPCQCTAIEMYFEISHNNGSEN